MLLDGVTWLDVVVVGPKWASGISAHFGFSRTINELVVATNKVLSTHKAKCEYHNHTITSEI